MSSGTTGSDRGQHPAGPAWSQGDPGGGDPGGWVTLGRDRPGLGGLGSRALDLGTGYGSRVDARRVLSIAPASGRVQGPRTMFRDAWGLGGVRACVSCAVG